MKIQALDWTMGEVANVFDGLKGGECMIDLGRWAYFCISSSSTGSLSSV